MEVLTFIMHNDKKFTELDMRDEFSLPVYVGYSLSEFHGIKGINPDHRFAGQLTRKNGETYLDLADLPKKKRYEGSGLVVDYEDRIKSQDDSHDWYASTWDGKLMFVLHKYFMVTGSENFSINNFGGEISRWLISDYSIVSQFMLLNGVKQVKLSLDYLYSWIGKYRPELDLTNESSEIFSGIKYQQKDFQLTIGAESLVTHHPHTFVKSADLYLYLDFKQEQSRDFAFQVAVVLRNLFQILIGKSVGISQVILNRDKSADFVNRRVSPKNYQENWFVDQAYLPGKGKETTGNYNVAYCDVEQSFQTILSEYFLNTRLQRLVSGYLTVDQFRLPLNTQIVTLVSVVETYYRRSHFSNGKKIKSAKEKFKRLVELVSEPDKVVNRSPHGVTTTAKALVERMVDARVFFVHGDKEEKISTEAELVPDLIAFKRLILCAITEIIIKGDKYDGE